MTQPPIANPGVRFPPPLLFVAGFLAGWLPHRRWAHHLLRHDADGLRLVLGWGTVAAGLVIILWAFGTFLRHRTAIYPNQPARGIVRDGPYRWTRNPMYVSLTLVYIGVSVLVNTLLPLLVLPLVLLLLVRLVIHREERYLASAFPEEYTAYRRDVGRWF